MDRSHRHRVTRQSSTLKSALANSIIGAPHNDLSSAWDSMDKAKSALRRAEHRLTDVEKPSSADILWNLPDYLFSMIEQDNQTSEIVHAASEARSPMSMNRKINKPVLSYQETRQPRESTVNQSTISGGSGRLSSVDTTLPTAITDCNDTCISNKSRPNASNVRSKTDSFNMYSTAESDLTSSTVIRETDINFLNDFTIGKQAVSVPAARMHRVNVVVPTAHNVSTTCQNISTSAHSNSANTRQLQSSASQSMPPHQKLKVTFVDAKLEGNSDSGKNVSDSSQPSSDADSLERIRELIRRQRPSEFIDESSTAVSRKVALGPRLTVPAYKGFNEVDSKSEHSKYKLAGSKVDQMKAMSVPSDQLGAHLSANVLHRPYRTVAPASDKNSKDIITTRTWRSGAKLVNEDLGVSITGASAPVKDSHTQSSSAAKGYETVSIISEPAEANLRLKDLVEINADESSANKRSVDNNHLSKPDRKNKTKRKPDYSDKATTVKKIHAENKDTAEVRRYMLKRREDYLLQERQEQQMKEEMNAKKKQKLVELMQKQQELVAASVAISREKTSKLKGSSLSNVADKENMSLVPTLDGMYSESETESENFNNPLHHFHSSQYRTDPHGDNKPATTVPKPLQNRTVINSESEGSLSAEQIVNRFAENAGLGLSDVISNYSKYAHAIQQSFAHKGTRAKPSEMNQQVVPTNHRSTMSRLKALQNASVQLQSRLQHETVRIQNDLAGQGLHGIASDRFDEPAVGNYSVNSSKHASFESDLPGFMGPQADGKVLQHVPCADDMDKGNICMQNTSASLFALHAVDESDKNSSRQHVKQDILCTSHSVVHSSWLTSSVNTNTHVLKPVRPVIAWQQPEPDQYNIFSILSRNQKLVELNSSKNRSSSVNTYGDVYPLHDTTSEHLHSVTDTEKKALSSYHQSIHADLLTKVTPDEELNSGSMWSVSLSGRDQDDGTHGVKLARSVIDTHGIDVSQRNDGVAREVMPLSARSLKSATDSFGASYKDDFTDNSESLLVDRYTDRQRSLSHHSGRQLIKHNGDVSGKDLVPTSAAIVRSNMDDSDTDVSEFPEISSLSSDQQAVSLSLHQHGREAAESQHNFRRGYVGMPGMSPAALDLRMALELNRLDMVDDSLLQVTNLERTRAVSIAQQETVALAQILKARQQKAAQDVTAARLKADGENLDMSKKLAASHQVEITNSLVRAATDATTTLHDSARTLANTQSDMARVTSEAVRQIAETSSLVLKRRDEDLEASHRLIAESAAKVAVSAVAGIVEHYQSQRPYIDARKNEARYNIENIRLQSVTPRSEALSAQVSDRSHVGSASARSDRSVTDIDKSYSESNSRRSKSRSDEFSVHSSKGESKRLNSENHSIIAEDLSTVVESNASNRNGKSESSRTSRKRAAAMSENTSPDSSEIHSATDLSVKSMSAISDGSAVHTATDQTTDKKPRYSVGSITSSIHTKSAISIHEDVSSDDNSESSVRTESTLKSQSIQQSVKSNQQFTEDEKVLDYTLDYDSTMTEDDLEKSLREIVPSEGQRKKIRNKKLLDTSVVEGGSADAADELAIAPDDSFTRFNMAMVQQYFREEAIHQQHKHTMLLLRERALKEKTALELACLDQMRQRLRDKGADDKHPDIIRKEKNIRKNHQLRQEELRRLQKASKLALEAQQLMLKETHDIAEIHRSSQQVKDKLKRAGVDPLIFSSPELATDEEQSPRTIIDETSRALAGGDDATRDKLKLELKLDKKYLTAREKQLRDRRRKVIEKLDVNERLKLKEEEIEHLEEKTKQLKRMKEDRKRTAENSLLEATSLVTDIPDGDVLDTSRTKPPNSIAEDLPSERIGGNRSLASVKEDLPSAMSSVRHTKSVSTVVDNMTDSVKNSSQHGSITDESSISEEISEARSLSDSTETSIGYSREKFDSVTEATATHRNTSDAALSVNVSKQLSRPINKSPPLQNSKFQRQLSGGGESDVSMNRSDVTSDHSDIENRIHSLTEKLKKCKSEAENLRREQRRQRKMKLKAEEQSLRQQIESYDSYIRLVKSELQTSPRTHQLTSQIPSFITSALDVRKTPPSSENAVKNSTASDFVPKTSQARDVVDKTSPVSDSAGKSSTASDDVRKTSSASDNSRKSSKAKDVPPKPHSSDSSGSEMTVVQDGSKLHISSSSNAEPNKSLSERKERQKQSDISLSESVAEDVNTAVDDASSLKLDLGASATSDRLQSAVTPRAIDSARTLADISEEYPVSARTTARDESSITGGVRQRGSDSTKLPNSPHPASVISAGGSYSEDFLSGGKSNSVDFPHEKRQSSAQPSTSQRNGRFSEESVPTEEDISDAALSDNDGVSESISNAIPAKLNQTSSSLSNADLPIVLPENQSADAQNDSEKDVKENQRVLSLTEGLVSEAIEQMLSIKKQKQTVSSLDDVLNTKPIVTAVPTVVHSVGTSTIPLAVPVSTDGQLNLMSDLEDLYSDLTSLKLDDDWLVEHEQTVKPQIAANTRPPVVAAPVPVIHVPHTTMEVARLIESAVDVLWLNQRDAKLREAARLSFVIDHEDSSNTNESRSRSVYKRLIYDLSAQALSELCDDSLAHVDATTQPWLQPRLRVRVPIPATAAAAKPLVSNAVLRRLGLHANKHSTASPRHSGRKVVRRGRADRVDELLSAELREEESEWTDYTNDELYVKMQLADVLFDMLLSETVNTLNSIHRHRKP